jgi:mercuric ion transport protein
MDRLKGVSMLSLAAVACPCHLPILLALLGGTTIGAVLAANVLPLFVLLGVVFVGALALGLRLLESGSGRACAPQEPRRSR